MKENHKTMPAKDLRKEQRMTRNVVESAIEAAKVDKSETWENYVDRVGKTRKWDNHEKSEECVEG
jgi:hypothetical protein